MNIPTPRHMPAAICAGIAFGLVLPAAASDVDGRTLFVESAVENPNDTVTLPLHQGVSKGRKVWYVLLDASDGKDAARYGINQAAKLANARGTAATQKVSVMNNTIVFPAAVDFTPTHRVVPGPSNAPFPPAIAEPGSVGEAGYSPLIEFLDGRILNAPIVAIGELNEIAADGTHRVTHDKIVSIDTSDPANPRVTLNETRGFAGGKGVKYVSTDASFALGAALEESTLAPALAEAPTVGGDGTDSARTSLAIFVNGQTGAGNAQRQGLNSALTDGGGPLNVLAWTPNQGRYSPVWDLFPAVWVPSAVAAGQNLRQTDFGKVRNLGQKGQVVSLDGGPFRAFPLDPKGAIVNCPIISQD